LGLAASDQGQARAVLLVAGLSTRRIQYSVTAVHLGVEVDEVALHVSLAEYVSVPLSLSF